MHYRIIGRRWFQRSYGNTYHSTEVVKCSGKGVNYREELIAKVGPCYGDGDQYMQTAADIFAGKGLLPGVRMEPNCYSAFEAYRRAHREQFTIVCYDVERQKDL